MDGVGEWSVGCICGGVFIQLVCGERHTESFLWGGIVIAPISECAEYGNVVSPELFAFLLSVAPDDFLIFLSVIKLAEKHQTKRWCSSTGFGRIFILLGGHR